MQRYKEFLKLPNKIHIKCYFRCIFNFCLICKVNSCHLFHITCRPPGNRTLRNLDCLSIRWLLPAVGEIRLLLSIANHRTASCKTKTNADASAKTIKFLKLFKRIIAPRRGAAPRFASLPDGVGDFLPLREDVGFPCVPLSLISEKRYNVTHSKPPLYEHSA